MKIDLQKTANKPEYIKVFLDSKKLMDIKTKDRLPTLNVSQEDIKKIRFNLGMTQLEFAKFLEVSIATVRAWEQGVNKPKQKHKGIFTQLS